MISLVVEKKIGRVSNRIYEKNWYINLHDIVIEILERKPDRAITIVLTDDDHMRELNATYRKLDRTTDVLSFLYDREPEASFYEGELFISMPLAQRQAKRYGTTILREMARLVIHGILHLYDYDHVKDKERVIMMRLSRRALAAAVAQKLC